MLRTVLAGIVEKPPKVSLGERCLSFARRHRVPKPILETLEACAYQGPIRIGGLWLSPLAEIDLENEEEENVPCIEHGFLILGSGLNGDPVALEIEAGRMAFISHDRLWERDYEHFEECVVRTPLGLDDFWQEAATNPEFPVDSCDAEDRWGTERG